MANNMERIINNHHYRIPMPDVMMVTIGDDYFPMTVHHKETFDALFEILDKFAEFQAAIEKAKDPKSSEMQLKVACDTMEQMRETINELKLRNNNQATSIKSLMAKSRRASELEDEVTELRKSFNNLLNINGELRQKLQEEKYVCSAYKDTAQRQADRISKANIGAMERTIDDLRSSVETLKAANANLRMANQNREKTLAEVRAESAKLFQMSNNANARVIKLENILDRIPFTVLERYLEEKEGPEYVTMDFFIPNAAYTPYYPGKEKEMEED